MSLSINNANLAEFEDSLTSGMNCPSIMDAGNIATYYPSYGAGGVTYGPPSLVTPEARDNLFSLRYKIEQSGIPLINGDELESELQDNRR